NIKKMKSEKGFTIVELLIVIVVIGILAAIIIVAYQGVTSRAKAAQYVTDVTSIIKKGESYAAINNNYALTAAGSDLASVTTQTTTGGTLTALFNATNETKLPASVAIFAVVAYGSGPSLAQANVAINISSTVNYYYVSYCTTGKGMRVYYPDPVGSTVKTSDVGVCP
ncbi:MAG: prepilin-type N-terminal cleavage/methylation domain-containing protein, partial [Candidatus Saccharimonadales bacterium]